MSIDIEDKTGHLVSERDIQDAIDAVSHAVPRVTQLMQTPALAVNLPNILRCLRELQIIRKHFGEQVPKGEP